jgi:hypothetical protein
LPFSTIDQQGEAIPRVRDGLRFNLLSAWKVRLVSFVPDIRLPTQHWFGGGWPAVALLFMHIAVWGMSA